MQYITQLLGFQPHERFVTVPGEKGKLFTVVSAQLRNLHCIKILVKEMIPPIIDQYR